MLFKTKLLLSLGTLGVAGGTGGGIYYVINNKDGNKPQEKSKEKFSGYFILKEKNKTDDDSDTSKVYEVALEENLEEEKKPEENKVCKLDDKNTLICKVSDIDKEEVEEYIKVLVSSVKGASTEELQKALKDKLTENGNFKEIFGEEIYKNIEDALKDVE